MNVNDFHEKITAMTHTYDEIITTNRWHFEFTNGWSMSVIQGPYCYSGPNNDLYELAVINPESEIDYNNPIADDVVGYLTEEAVIDHLRMLALLTAEELQHHRDTHVSPYDEEEEGDA